jgi:hypothetical protein
MADAISAAFSMGNAALSIRQERRKSYDRNSFYLSIGPKSREGDCPALVVPEFVPCLARAAAMRRMQAAVAPGNPAAHQKNEVDAAFAKNPAKGSARTK